MDYASSTLTINLAAITANYKLLSSMAKNSECAAVVKANAYGLGIEKVAPALAKAGCRSFFVATLDEGIQLRGILPKVDIYVFHGVQENEQEPFQYYRLIPVLNDFYQISLWNHQATISEKKLPAVIHVDTGMCRLGLGKRAALYLEANRDLISGLEIRFIMSHLACADEPDHYKNSRQLVNFCEIQKYTPEMKLSLANSSGIFLGPKFQFDIVRPGSALYGINPIPTRNNPMWNVVTVTSRILQIRDIDIAQTVGYGASHHVLPGSLIAVVAVGYADGYFRNLSNKGQCAIAGKLVPVIGRVSMDLITVDITSLDANEIHPGTPVQLIGDLCPADKVAAHAGTNAYELFTGLGARLNRIYL